MTMYAGSVNLRGNASVSTRPRMSTIRRRRGSDMKGNLQQHSSVLLWCVQHLDQRRPSLAARLGVMIRTVYCCYWPAAERRATVQKSTSRTCWQPAAQAPTQRARQASAENAAVNQGRHMDSLRHEEFDQCHRFDSSNGAAPRASNPLLDTRVPAEHPHGHHKLDTAHLSTAHASVPSGQRFVHAHNAADYDKPLSPAAMPSSYEYPPQSHYARPAYAQTRLDKRSHGESVTARAEALLAEHDAQRTAILQADFAGLDLAPGRRGGAAPVAGVRHREAETISSAWGLRDGEGERGAGHAHAEGERSSYGRASGVGAARLSTAAAEGESDEEELEVEGEYGRGYKGYEGQDQGNEGAGRAAAHRARRRAAPLSPTWRGSGDDGGSSDDAPAHMAPSETARCAIR